MGTLKIELDDYGVVQLFVDDELVGLVQDLTLSAGMDLKPRVLIGFPLAEGPKMRETIEKYQTMVLSNPHVELHDPADTLPSGEIPERE